MIRSFWFAAVLALILGVGTCAGALLLNWKSLVTVAKSETPPRLLTSRERGWDFWSGEIDALSKALKTERAGLDDRKKDLDALGRRLEAEKKELLRVRAEVEAVRDEISQKIPILKASEKVNLKALSRSYTAMNPQQAVVILTEMDDVSMTKILSLMKPDVVGAIFQAMAGPPGKPTKEAARAARLSDQLRLLQREDPVPTP